MIALATSNTLKNTDGDLTGIIKYRGDDNQYGIDWYNAPNDFYVQVRIPGTLQNTKFPINETIYRQSDGYFRRAKTFIEKVKELKTDWEPEDFHEGLVTALKHDEFFFNDTQYFNEGEYDQEYSDFDEYSQATAVLTTQRYNRTNHQC